MWSPNGPLDADVVLRDGALEHDLGVRRHLEVDRLALHELDLVAAQEAGHHQLVDVMRERRRRRVRGHRVEAERDGDRDLAVLRREQIGAAVLVHLPVHVRGAAVDDLHAVHAYVPRTLSGSFVITAGSVMNGAGSPGQHVWMGSRVMSTSSPVSTISWQTPLETTFGRESAIDLSFFRPWIFSRRPSRRLHLQHVGELLGDGVEARRAERHGHAPLGAELVDQQRMLGALRVLEEQRRPAARLHEAVDDLGDLEVRVDLGRDPVQLALALEQRDPVAEVFERRHAALSLWRRGACSAPPASSITAPLQRQPGSSFAGRP